METIESSAEDYLDMVKAEEEFRNETLRPVMVEDDETEEA
jgi:hypothetical protein